jgi:hypothetical protein
MATITLENVPDDLLEKIEAVAEASGRSTSEEILLRLRQSLAPDVAQVVRRGSRAARVPKAQLLASIRRFRESVGAISFTLAEIDQAKRTGRP